MNWSKLTIMSLSVIIIAKNESGAIGDCLASVAWADERIVLDGGSIDETVAIARDRGARVAVADDWQGFGVQKNRVLDMASGDWVLSLDADERVSDALKAQSFGGDR
jgi:Glycosyltransferases involved in cell wall biogenesis